MGSKEIKIDHQTTYEIWSDPFFWEHAPSWEHFREEAEVIVMEALSVKTSLFLKRKDLYNKWLESIKEARKNDPAKLLEIVNFIRKKRGRSDETIKIQEGRATIIIAESSHEANKTY